MLIKQSPTLLIISEHIPLISELDWNYAYLTKKWFCAEGSQVSILIAGST